MSSDHVKEFYSKSSGESPKGNFHDVIVLQESPHLDWKLLSKKVPSLSKGWFELSRLPPADRIEFSRDFWLAKMPYHPILQKFLMTFFSRLDDVGVYATQQKFDDPYEVHLVYNLKGDDGFFKGSPPITDEELIRLKEMFPDIILPEDYLAFLQIHNGFCKATDCTGIKKSSQMKICYEALQSLLTQKGVLLTSKGEEVDPTKLIPFYESFGMPFYQCFWAEWYPEQEMGNVYYSGVNHSISDVKDSEKAPSETMAFPSFADWLMFYLEQIA